MLERLRKPLCLSAVGPLICAAAVAHATTTTTGHEVTERFLTECLPMIEAEQSKPDGVTPFSEIHILAWRTMRWGSSSCIISISSEYDLPDDQRDMELATRRAVSADILKAAQPLEQEMVAQGYLICADQATGATEYNKLLVKPLQDGRGILSGVWVNPSHPIAVMNVSIVPKMRIDELHCEAEIS